MPIQCTDCGDVVWSKCGHDFAACSCFGNAKQTGCAIDGGDWYTRIIGMNWRPTKWRPVMSGTKYDMVIAQGETWERRFTYLKDDAAVDLTGAEIRMQVRKGAASESVLAQYSLGDGFSIDSPLEGKFSLLISATETSAMDFPWGVYDIEIEFPNVKVVKLLYGSIKVRQEVTRW